MNHPDPILHYFSTIARRILLFVILALLVSVGVWAWLLFGFYELTTEAARAATLAALPTVTNRTGALMLAASGVIGLLTTTSFYLMIGWWWSRRADVHHRRGAQLTDRR
jgi:NADH:ubiquinone oxidoreductase subunit 5 (subunit L)/multisubunit Na+/H+ antiporter MnhA subunit